MNNALKIAATTAAVAGIAVVGYGAAYLCGKLLNRKNSTRVTEEVVKDSCGPLEVEQQLMANILADLNSEIEGRRDFFETANLAAKKTIREILLKRHKEAAEAIKDTDLALSVQFTIRNLIDEKLPLPEATL